MFINQYNGTIATTVLVCFMGTAILESRQDLRLFKLLLQWVPSYHFVGYSGNTMESICEKGTLSDRETIKGQWDTIEYAG